ncbi:hypothetical protein P5G65_15730 [Paenibacillus chondroitinus]|uniref:PhnB-like domain-containing protein n=1 Tax=Paenibacillus chondroitinus TaxID=59842 RepID=A0ABU6DC71_9BACL|nr:MULTISPECIES: hypothetical protein [Paenibacillus]MCY9660027.1 hypothetical protein [Paenibacillus anseongense]MEB4795355.1 hypothetical protein [Paenibacillus chondroitinus]
MAAIAYLNFDGITEQAIEFYSKALSEMLWSSCFGMLVDKFGVTWKFNSDADKFLDKVISSKR